MRIHRINTTRFIWKYVVLLIFIVAIVVLANRLSYQPENIPELHYKVGKGCLEPEIMWGIAFSSYGEKLYMINATGANLKSKENVLTIWNLNENKIESKMKLSFLQQKTIACLDVKENKILIAAKGIVKEHIYVYDSKNGNIDEHFTVDGVIYGVSFDQDDDIIYSQKEFEPKRILKTYHYKRSTQTKSPKKIHLKYDWMSSALEIYPLDDINHLNNRKVIFDKKSPYLIVDDPLFKININDKYKHRINSVSICSEKDYFAIVSSPIDMRAFPISYHYLVHPVENYTTVALYRYSTGERVFCESYPNYPSYVCKISPDDKWLAVTVGGYVYVYNIDEISGEKKAK